MRLQVSYGERGAAVIRVAGEVDLLSAPRLHELVGCRLRSGLRELVLDVSEVSFMSVAGAQVLAYAATFARHHGKRLHVDVGDSPAVERVLRSTGLHAKLPLGTPS